jgi:hypothetical protein
MDNLAFQLIDSLAQENVPFIVSDDFKAEWTLKRISEDRAETQRMISVCENMINEYQAKIEKLTEQHNKRTSYLESQLQRYFNEVPHKETKTQETYRLPSGTLKLKKPAPEFVRDEEELLRYMESHNYQDFIQVKKSVKWSELKKDLVADGKYAVDKETGQIVQGITVQERDPIFEIEC